MRRITLNEVVTEGKVVEYRGYATKDNGIEVEIAFTPQELLEIVKKVEKTQTREELAQDIVNKKLVEEVGKGEAVDERLIPEWEENTQYEENQPVKKFGIVYYANKKHKSDNQSNPIFDTDTWRKEIKKVEEEGINPEYSENIESAKFWNRDETFEAGTYVKWYGELYKATEKISDGVEPGISDKWKKIEKMLKED